MRLLRSNVAGGAAQSCKPPDLQRHANPSLSNNDIALRVHIEGKGDASRLLARLARFGLIENTRTRGRENEWQLTPAGKELETAIRHDAGRAK